MSDLIRRTRYMHDALGALVGDHIDAAQRVLSETGGEAIRIATARSYLASAKLGLRRLQREHGIAPDDERGFGHGDGMEAKPTQAGWGARPASTTEAV